MSDLKQRDPELYVTMVELCVDAQVRLKSAMEALNPAIIRLESLVSLGGGIPAALQSARDALRDVQFAEAEVRSTRMKLR